MVLLATGVVAYLLLDVVYDPWPTELAAQCAEHGWFMSFAGPVTFKANDHLREAMVLAPADLLLVETDAPFLTPHPFRGAPNEPYCLPYTVRALAEVVDRPAELVAETVEELCGGTTRVHVDAGPLEHACCAPALLDPHDLVVATVLSAQCTDVRVKIGRAHV